MRRKRKSPDSAPDDHCGSHSSKTSPHEYGTVFAMTDSDIAQHEKLYRRWLFDLWYGDFAAAAEIFTPDFVGHWPSHEVHGPQAVADQIRQSRALFSDIENTLDVGPVISSGLCAARWTFHGSYLGGIPGTTATPGTRISFSGHDIFRVDNGRFAEYWVISDSTGMMQQLGAV